MAAQVGNGLQYDGYPAHDLAGTGEDITTPSYCGGSDSDYAPLVDMIDAAPNAWPLQVIIDPQINRFRFEKAAKEMLFGKGVRPMG